MLLADAYKRASNDLRGAIRRARTVEEVNVLNSGNSKKFFSFVNKKLSSKATIPSLRTPDGRVATSAVEKANMMNTLC